MSKANAKAKAIEHSLPTLIERRTPFSKAVRVKAAPEAMSAVVEPPMAVIGAMSAVVEPAMAVILATSAVVEP